MVELVTVHLWRVAARAVPAVLGTLATERRRVRALEGVRFAKLLGTGGDGFTPRDTDLRRWALVTSWTSADAATRFAGSAPERRWRRRAVESWQARLRPLDSRGEWSRRRPFGAPAPTALQSWDGPVAAITRSRLAVRRAMEFWRAVPPVAADVRRRPGLCLTFGIGEAPLGVQGTFSLWRDDVALREFAYGGSAHRRVIREAAARGWFAEQLFARFAVLSTSGTVDGVDPLETLR